MQPHFTNPSPPQVSDQSHANHEHAQDAQADIYHSCYIVSCIYLEQSVNITQNVSVLKLYFLGCTVNQKSNRGDKLTCRADMLLISPWTGCSYGHPCSVSGSVQSILLNFSFKLLLLSRSGCWIDLARLINLNSTFHQSHLLPLSVLFFFNQSVHTKMGFSVFGMFEHVVRTEPKFYEPKNGHLLSQSG